jgi:two-component system, LytTR family, sensor kinase
VLIIMTKRNRIILEVLFFVVIYFITSGTNINPTLELELIGICIYCILYAHAMFNRFVLLPLLFPQKQYLKYFASTLAVALSLSLFLYKIDIYYATKYSFPELKYLTYLNSVYNCLFSLLIMASIEFVFQYFKQEQEKVKYNELIRQLENNNLKSQLNPHFLFNSLNNAYGISLSDPSRAPEYIMQLSQLMRYQLESTKNTYVHLRDEIEFIENYLAVESERIGVRCAIKFDNKIDEFCQNKLQIIPMLFMTFIENAIKHGSASIDSSYINIEMKNIENDLEFNIQNSIPKKRIAVIGTRTGLINARQRLDSMYLNNYKLDELIDDEKYIINLKITLKIKL